MFPKLRTGLPSRAQNVILCIRNWRLQSQPGPHSNPRMFRTLPICATPLSLSFFLNKMGISDSSVIELLWGLKERYINSIVVHSTCHHCFYEMLWLPQAPGSPSTMQHLELEDKQLCWEWETGISVYQRFLLLVVAWGSESWDNVDWSWKINLE